MLAPFSTGSHQPFSIFAVWNEELSKRSQFWVDAHVLSQVVRSVKRVKNWSMHVHFCVRCVRFMRKFAPTKTFKTPSKSFKTTTKTIKRLQIAKTRSLCFLMFSAICKKMEMLSLLLLFCRVLTEFCVWKKHGHDCKFEHCACVCVHITMRIGMHDLFCERPFETRFFP